MASSTLKRKITFTVTGALLIAAGAAGGCASEPEKTINQAPIVEPGEQEKNGPSEAPTPISNPAPVVPEGGFEKKDGATEEGDGEDDGEEKKKGDKVVLPEKVRPKITNTRPMPNVPPPTQDEKDAESE